MKTIAKTLMGAFLMVAAARSFDRGGNSAPSMEEIAPLMFQMSDQAGKQIGVGEITTIINDALRRMQVQQTGETSPTPDKSTPARGSNAHDKSKPASGANAPANLFDLLTLPAPEQGK